MNDQEQEKTASAEAAAKVWAGYDPELQEAIIAKDPTAERLYRAEAYVEQLRQEAQTP